MEQQWRDVGLDGQALILSLEDIEQPVQVAVAADDLPALSVGPAFLYARACYRSGDAASRPSQGLRSMTLAQVAEQAAAAGAGVLLDDAAMLSPALVARVARSRVLWHRGQRWLLEYCATGSALELRNLLALRSLHDVPALQVWRATCLAAVELSPEYWLLLEQPLRTTQLQRCEAKGYRCWTAEALSRAQPQLAGLAASLPPSRMVGTVRRSANAWIAPLLLGLVLLVGLGWKVLSDRQHRIQAQNAQAAATLYRLFNGVERGYLDPLYVALIRLGVPASVDGGVIDRTPPQGLDAAAQRQMLEPVLGTRLAAQLDGFAALDDYLVSQARRIGQRRMILSGEYCRYGSAVVMPLLANRNFVLTLERPPGVNLVKWAGVEQIDARHLTDCGALGLPPPE